jgi:adenylate cyclase
MSDSKNLVFHKHMSKFISLGICSLITISCLSLLWRHYRRGGDASDLVGQVENRLLDLRFLLRGARTPSNKVGILAIDERSLQKFGRFPFSRKHYEKALKNLKKLGVDWIGFDVVWSKPELPLLSDIEPNLKRIQSIEGPHWKDALKKELAEVNNSYGASLADQGIARAIKDFKNIVLGFFYYASEEEAKELGENRFDGLASMESAEISALVFPGNQSLGDYPGISTKGIVANDPYIASHANHFAFFNNESDADAIMRWVTLVKSVKGKLMPSLSLKTAAEILNREILVEFDDFGITAINLVSRENDQDLLNVPVDHQGLGRILINHLGPDKTIPHFSLADAYDGTFSEADKKRLQGMSLLLGPTAIAINDQRANPFDAGINGVENHAAVIDNIISKNFMKRTEKIYLTEILVVLGIGLFFSPLMVFSRALLSGFGALLFVVGYYYFDRYFWFTRGEWVYMGMPLIEITGLFVGTTLFKYTWEEREKKKVKGAFSLYLAPEVIDKVLDDPEALKPGGERKDLTVFFSDVRSFTTISESLTPEKLCELMNEYFTPMADIILRTRGVLDKYIGDAIMAFWGAPVTLPNHAETAALASIEMLFALDKLKADFTKKGFPSIDIGIGLNTGPMSVGNMGSPQRFCYTVMGDAVNLGSRLEGATKDYGIKIMISEFTKAKLTRKDLFTRDLDDIKVKGKMEPIKVFELIRPDILRNANDIMNLIGNFEMARKAYREQQWENARKYFTHCLAIRPNDGPSLMYIERIAEREKDPFIPNWDGVYVRKHK